MKVKTLQYSIKFEMLPNIHRFANQVEDAMNEWYGLPNIISYPPNMQSVDAPRIVAMSNNAEKSQLLFSQISATIINEDADWPHNEIFSDKVKRLNNLLSEIGVTRYYFTGLSIAIEKKKDAGEAAKEICNRIHIDFSEDVYESAYAIVRKKDDTYFLNEKISSQKEMPNGMVFLSQDLVNYANEKKMNELILIELDANDRLRYLNTGTPIPIVECEEKLKNISNLLKEKILELE